MATAVQVREESPQFRSLSKARDVPRISKDSQLLLENAVFSNETYWVRRAFTDACSLSDRANEIVDLVNVVDPEGNELVNKAIPIVYIAAGILLFLGGAALAGYLISLGWIYCPIAICVIDSIISSAMIGKGGEVLLRENNTRHLYKEWLKIKFQKGQMNNICMGVIDLPSFISEDPSLKQAKRELTNVWNWIRG